MTRIRFIIGVVFIALLAAWRMPRLPLARGETAASASGEIIFGHITDEHIDPATPVPENYAALVEALRYVKLFNPALLISTGDLTDQNDEYSYNQYNKALKEVGGYSYFPDYTVGIPFRPVAGNHDYFGISPWPRLMGPPQHSFTVGGYRFIGFSGDTARELPTAWLEQEMRKSCQDGKPIILYHHYPPTGWHVAEHGDMSAENWQTLQNLAQRYPVLALLAGHSHVDRLEAIAPGFFVHTAGPASRGHLAIYSLHEGAINYRAARPRPTRLMGTYPHQYYESLDYTQTHAEQVTVRAYAATHVGAITRVYYRLNDGPIVDMAKAGTTPYYEAPLDARNLSGTYTLTLTALHSEGSWATESYSYTVRFSSFVPLRKAPACDCLPRTVAIPLQPGWNMVSLPVTPTNGSPDRLFASLVGAYDQVYAYDAHNSARPWLSYKPALPPVLNNLPQIGPGDGLWVHATQSASWLVTGTLPSEVRVPLYAGWNLVSGPLRDALPIPLALGSIDGQYDLVYTYTVGDPHNPWLIYDSAGSPPQNTLHLMEPGKSYWVHALQNCTWVMP